MTLANPRHETFAQHFAETGSVTDAARAAGYSRHLSSRGSDLLRRPEVRARVETLVAMRLSKTGHLAPAADALRALAETVLQALGEPTQNLEDLTP
jgi:phage terminase small subunit